MADDVRKRKSCQSCIRAKAKCSPSELSNICYRCHRLNRECVFEEALRKKGPKTRSRVRQLEQRFDTLIDLLAANNQSSNGVHSMSSSTEPVDTPTIAVPSTADQRTNPIYITPVETPNSAPISKTFDTYDPIEAGVIEEDSAGLLLDQFRGSFAWSFPFVVIPESTDVNTLRLQQPFLFLAIMAVMTHATPSIQRVLGAELKSQISLRIVGKSHKSLEILQGLLVYSGWYHFFYHPEDQQLAIIIQLCVAMVQDLGLSKNPRDKLRKLALTEEQCGLVFKAERSAAEKRAFLGTYYLTAEFAQTWRKRGTMPHTKFMKQCYQYFAESPEECTDRLIAPLLQLSELMSRVNDHFSYDDLDNVEVTGELMLEMSTINFRSELEQIKGAIHVDLKPNTTIKLKLIRLEMWIYEICLHSPLWDSPTSNTTPEFPPCRVRMLHRTMKAMSSYFDILVAVPDQLLYRLSLSAWAGWFYANIVACKLVFLQDKERYGETNLEDIARSILLPTSVGPGSPHSSCSMNLGSAEVGICWDPCLVAREAGVQQHFERVIRKLKFTFPADPTAPDRCAAGELESSDHDPLFCMAFLQSRVLTGYSKRMNNHLSRSAPVDVTSASGSSSALTPESSASIPYQQHHLSSLVGKTATSQAHSQYGTRPISSRALNNLPTEVDYAQPTLRDHLVPFINSLNHAIDFEGIEIPASLPLPQGMTEPNPYDDIVWDLMMEDFSMPPL